MRAKKLGNSLAGFRQLWDNLELHYRCSSMQLLCSVEKLVQVSTEIVKAKVTIKMWHFWISFKVASSNPSQWFDVYAVATAKQKRRGNLSHAVATGWPLLWILWAQLSAGSSCKNRLLFLNSFSELEQFRRTHNSWKQQIILNMYSKIIQP